MATQSVAADTDFEPRREFYIYCFAHEFDIDKALELIDSNGVPFSLETIDVKSWAEATLAAHTYPCNEDGTYSRPQAINITTIPIDPTHALAIPEQVAERPGIAILLPRPDGTSFPLFTDGHHRLFRAYVKKVERMSVYVIADPEAIKKFYAHSVRVKSLFPRRRRKKASK